jgi:hypothetical protein
MIDASNMDTIVREVLRRLTQMSSPTAQQAAAPAANELRISQRVVTLRHCDGSLDGVSRVIVPLGAVVTPAVRDELQRRKISLEHEEQGEKKSSSLQLLLATEDPRICLQRWRRETAADVAYNQSHDLDALALHLATWVAPQRVAALWTTRPRWALCIANRHPAIRAAMAGDVLAVEQVIAEAGANVLVLDSSRHSSMWRNMIRNFCRGGFRLAPAH